MKNILMFTTWKRSRHRKTQFYDCRVGHLRVKNTMCIQHSIITIKVAFNDLKRQTLAGMRYQCLFTFPGIVVLLKAKSDILGFLIVITTWMLTWMVFKLQTGNYSNFHTTWALHKTRDVCYCWMLTEKLCYLYLKWWGAQIRPSNTVSDTNLS